MMVLIYLTCRRFPGFLPKTLNKPTGAVIVDFNRETHIKRGDHVERVESTHPDETVKRICVAESLATASYTKGNLIE
jgi:hypothetical protein